MFLSRREPGPEIYLINQTESLPSTSNSTEYFVHLMSRSSHLTSPVDSSLRHLQYQRVTTMSRFQPQWVYKQASSTQIIQYRLCSCLDNSSSSPSLHLTTACCSWMFHSQMRRLCSWGACLACQEAASRYFASPLALFLRLLTCLPRGHRSQLRKSTWFLFSSQLNLALCCAVYCSCEPELPSGTTLPTQDWMPLWHGFGSFLLRKSLLLRARSCYLVPLY